MTQKRTWRYYIGNDKYHTFKSFKVYWAFCWLQAEIAENNIFKEMKQGKEVVIVKLNKEGIYTNKYKNT